MEIFVFTIVLFLLLSYFRSVYFVRYVERFLNIKIPEFEDIDIELPDKDKEVSEAEHLNFYAGKYLAEKVEDARLIGFETKKQSKSMVYFSKAYFSLFEMKIFEISKSKVKISISGNKIVKVKELKEEIEKNKDYFIPYKILKNEVKYYESIYNIKLFDFSIIKGLFSKKK